MSVFVASTKTLYDHSVTKFHVDRACNFEIYSLFIFCQFGLKMQTTLTSPETIDNSTCSRSIDMVDVHRNLNGSRDPTTPLSGMVCNPWASTCCRQPTNQI